MINKLGKQILVCLALCMLAVSAWAQLPEPSDDLVNALMAKREALFDGRQIDVAQLSRDITAAIREGERLEALGQRQQALNQLLALQKYMPLEDMPSFDVHMLSGWLYDKLGQPDLARRHQELASAYRKLLWTRLGTGNSAADPLRLVMPVEMAEWAKTQLSRVTDVKLLPTGGSRLFVATATSTAGVPPRQVFFQLDARQLQAANRKLEVYTPIPLEQLRPDDLAQLTLAKDKRKRFLDDAGFAYLELRDKITLLLRESAQLDMAGKTQESLAKLREIEKIRPIEEIPTPRLLGWYSYLMGKTGNTAKQMEMRGLIFGIQQDIAHSGDGRSAATAIHVVMVDEEYQWLQDKKLKMVRQALQEKDGQNYDVLTVQNAQGAESTIYFNITKLFSRYLQVVKDVKTN